MKARTKPVDDRARVNTEIDMAKVVMEKWGLMSNDPRQQYTRKEVFRYLKGERSDGTLDFLDQKAAD